MPLTTVTINEIEFTINLNDRGELIRIPPETRDKMEQNGISKEQLKEALKAK